LKPVVSSAADIIFSGNFITPSSASNILYPADDDILGGAQGGFDLPRRAGGRPAPGAKDASPAGALFSGALLGAGQALTPASPKGSEGAPGYLEEGIPAAGASEPFIRLGGLSDHVEGILRCRRIVFIACGTSYHACLAARKTLEEFAAMPVVVELAGDFMVRTFFCAAPLGGGS
jgi:hypothetical protein